MNHLRVGATALVAIAALVACDPSGGHSSGNATSSEHNSPVKSMPALPDSLPTFASAENTEKTMRALIALAAQHAVGVPTGDRSPKVQATSDFSCPPNGVKVKAEACPPTTANETVVIDINPGLTWEQFNEPIGHGGGNAVTQNAVLASYAQYLAYRDIQRKHPELLTVTITSSDADKQRQAFMVTAQTVMCKNGEIFAGLKGAMSPELRQMWQASANAKVAGESLGGYFAKGTRGEC